MALSYANLLAEVLQFLQDAGAAIFATAETQYGIENELKHLSRYSPQIIDVIYRIESRTGTDVTGTASSLTDSVKAQFVATDATEEKVVYNSTDHTWAVVLLNSSTSVNTLSADIMDANEKYEIYNKRCRNKRQIYIGDMPSYLSVESVEYPIGTPRNFTEISDDVIEIDVYDSIIPDSDSTLSTLNKTEVLVKYAIPHVVCQLTDLAGAVHTAGVVGAATMQVKDFTDDEVVEIGEVFTIANHRATYVVTTALTLSTQASTGSLLSFYPGLESATVGGDVITFKKSSLKPAEENFLIRLVSARACISKSTSYYAQVNTAVTTLTNSATAVVAVAARVTQAIADIASGRVEAAKISAILDTANTEIDKIGARLTQAATDIGAGRTEADKIPTITTAAGTAIAAVAARITQALTDIASARTAIALGVTAIASADTEMGLTNAQVDLAVTALASGNSLVNTIPVGGGAPEYMGQAASDVGAAQGFMLSGQGLLQKSSADFNNANVDLGAASREVDAGMAKVREAQASLEQANTDMGANRTYIDQAVAQIRLAQGYFQEGQGYILESNTRMGNNASYLQSANGELRAGSSKVEEATVNMKLVASRLQVSQGGLRFDVWGNQQLDRAESELRTYGGFPGSRRYARD